MSFLRWKSIQSFAVAVAFGSGVKVSAQPWVQTTSLPEGYAYQALAYSAGYVYHSGGSCIEGGGLEDGYVYYAPVYSNGLVGAWTKTTPLPVPTSWHAGLAANGYLYVLGGYEDPSGNWSATNVVYYANLNADGSVGSWLATAPLPYPIVTFGAAAWNGRIYITGGNLGSYFTNAVWSAQIQANGSLSSWDSQPSLPISLCAHACTANGTLYVLGGDTTNGSPFQNTAYYSKIKDDGSLGSWNATTPLPTGIVDSSAVAANGRVYVLGGGDSTGSETDVWCAPVVALDGSLGTWSKGQPLPKSAGQHDTACTGSSIIMSGGFSLDNSLKSVYSMSLPTPPNPPSLTLQLATNGGVELTIFSTTNTGFGFMASTNLASWINIGADITGTNGTIIIQDSNSASFPSRFYKLYWPLP